MTVPGKLIRSKLHFKVEYHLCYLHYLKVCIGAGGKQHYDAFKEKETVHCLHLHSQCVILKLTLVENVSYYIQFYQNGEKQTATATITAECRWPL